MSPKSRKRKPKPGGGRPAVRSRQPPAPEKVPLFPLLPVADGLPHPEAIRHPSRPLVRVALTLVLGVMTYLVLSPVIFSVVTRIGFELSGSSDYAGYQEQARLGAVPEGLLASNLGTASLIVVSLVLMRWFQLAPPALLMSVVRRVRWGYLAAAGGVALLVFGVIQGISLGIEGVVLRPQAQFGWFLAVILLTSPLQAAAEEMFFRGFLQQGLGSLTGRWWLGVLLTSLLFALAHGTQSPALFANRFVFGLLAGVLVWRTGGLEAAIGVHVVNNVLAFVLAGLTTSIAEVRQISVLSWGQSAFDIATYGLIVAGCWLIARRWRLARVTG